MVYLRNNLRSGLSLSLRGRKKQRSAVCTTATQELDQRGKNLFRNVSRKSGNIIMSILEGKWRDYGER